MSGRLQVLATGNFRYRHTVVEGGSLELGVEDNDGLSQQACTALSEEQSANADHHASAVTDHARISRLP